MNIVVLDPGESGALLPRSDRRHGHIGRILKKKPGDSVAAGCTDGTLGTALVTRIDEGGLVLDYRPEGSAPPLRPVILLMGFPRPIQAGRILKDLTSLGVRNIWFTLSELGEKSYAQSDMFAKSDFGTFLREGAEQAGNPRLPEVRTFWSVGRALDALDGLTAPPGAGVATTRAPAAMGATVSRVLFHPDAGARRFSELGPFAAPLCLAVGSERGWTEAELGTLADRGFAAAQLGDRILKSETAAAAATVLALQALGYL